MFIAGLVGLWFFAHSKWVDGWLSKAITYALKRWTNLEIHDYADLLHLSGGYAVIELHVEAGDWLADRTLQELNIFDEGILVLGIEKRDGSYLGAPRGHTRIFAEDTVLLYGPKETLSDLDRRRRDVEGYTAHREAVQKQKQVEADEEAQTLPSENAGQPD